MHSPRLDDVTSDSNTEMPMFPLGSTVFPGQVVPLHIFEERYRQLMADLTQRDTPEFGIVLIERGHEVGGGDARATVATRVEVAQFERYDDGRWGVIAVGRDRLDVVEWLDDAPYPRAIVRSRARVDDGGALDDLETALRAVLTEAVRRSGGEIPEDLALSNDPHERLDQLAALAPTTTFDRQRVLEAESTSAQIRLLTEQLEDLKVILDATAEDT